jgi:hypothetical protein
MAIFDRSFSGNLPKILAAQMKFEVLKQYFWGKFSQFNVPGDVVTINKNRIPEPTQSPIVMQHELEREGGDLIKIPLLRNLKNLPRVGLEQAEDHEEEMKMNFTSVPIDILREPVKTQEGIMSYQTTKDYQLLEMVKPAMLRHYATVQEFLGAGYALYYGFSYNILESGRWAGNSNNITAYSHPNIFVAGQGKASYDDGYPGSDEYETTVGTMLSAIQPSHVLNTTTLKGLKAQKLLQKLDPIIMKDGNPFWLLVAHPYQIAQLEADEAFMATANAAFVQNLAKDNPLLIGAKYFYAGFAIFESSTAAWQVSVDSGVPIWGPSSIANLDSFDDYEDASMFAAIVMGNNALFKATGSPMEFLKRETDYGEIKGTAYRTVEGYSRADWWNDDDGTRGEYLVNNGSALLITAASQPSM